MGDGDLNPDCFCGKLQVVPMSPQISTTLGEEKKNLYYIKWALYKFMEVLAFFNRYFFLIQSNCYLVLSIKNL